MSGNRRNPPQAVSNDPAGPVVPSVEPASPLPTVSHLERRRSTYRHFPGLSAGTTIRTANMEVESAALDAAGVPPERVGDARPQQEELEDRQRQRQQQRRNQPSAGTPRTPPRPTPEPLSIQGSSSIQESTPAELANEDFLPASPRVFNRPRIPEQLRRRRLPTAEEIEYPFGRPEQQRLSESQERRLAEWDDSDREDQLRRGRWGRVGRRRFRENQEQQRLHDPMSPADRGTDAVSRQVRAEFEQAQAHEREQKRLRDQAQALVEGRQRDSHRGPMPEQYGGPLYVVRQEWPTVQDYAEAMVPLDPGNPDMRDFRRARRQFDQGIYAALAPTGRRSPEWSDRREEETELEYEQRLYAEIEAHPDSPTKRWRIEQNLRRAARVRYEEMQKRSEEERLQKYRQWQMAQRREEQAREDARVHKQFLEDQQRQRIEDEAEGSARAAMAAAEAGIIPSEDEDEDEDEDENDEDEGEAGAGAVEEENEDQDGNEQRDAGEGRTGLLAKVARGLRDPRTQQERYRQRQQAEQQRQQRAEEAAAHEAELERQRVSLSETTRTELARRVQALRALWPNDYTGPRDLVSEARTRLGINPQERLRARIHWIRETGGQGRVPDHAMTEAAAARRAIAEAEAAAAAAAAAKSKSKSKSKSKEMEKKTKRKKGKRDEEDDGGDDDGDGDDKENEQPPPKAARGRGQGQGQGQGPGRSRGRGRGRGKRGRGRGRGKTRT